MIFYRNRLLTVWFVFMVLILASCKNQAPTKTQDQLGHYVSGFTSGELSKKSSIIVQFTSDFSEPMDPNGLISFQPSIQGTTQWKDSRTLEFQPEKDLTPGTSYTGLVKLDRLFPSIPENLQDFKFNIYTRARAFDINLDHLVSSSQVDLKFQEIRGALNSSDYEDPETIEPLLSATQEGISLPISWEHDQTGEIHRFTIKNIERKTRDSEVHVVWSGNVDGYRFDGKKTLSVPSLKFFGVISATQQTGPDPCLEILFTDPLLAEQDLTGMIHMEDHEFRFIIKGNLVQAFSDRSFNGKKTLYIEPGIRNIAQTRLQTQTNFEMTFEDIKPQLRLTGNKVIVPTSKQVLFPFETANLSAVDVRVTRILEKNATQFFQVNSLEGEQELFRVGEVVLQKKLELDPDHELDLRTWNHHVLDLAELVNLDPGSIYQVSMAFRAAYSLYDCPSPVESDEVDLDLTPPTESSFWDVYENQSYYYSYRDRNNPCKKAYYGQNTMVSRNVLASNLGIMAKGSDAGKFLLCVTDMLTCQPLEGVTLEVYNFQQKLLSSSRTGRDGMTSFEFESQKPFLVIAKKGTQRGYLKLLDGLALTLSRFEVSGSEIKSGLNGFIYGDRGVWRPGDNVYLNLVLQDKENQFPDDHPVSFRVRDPQGRLILEKVLTDRVDQFYPVQFRTDADAPTGDYFATFQLGSIAFHKMIKIETIKPNRLKIKLDLGKDELFKQNQPYEADLDLTWLHGAIARNLKADIELSLKPQKTVFKSYSDYTFDDPVTSFRSDPVEIFKGQVDQQGHAHFKFPIKTETRSPGALKAHFLCKAFEPTGEFSVDRMSLTYHPFQTYAGIKLPRGDEKRGMLLTDTEHKVQIVTLDAKGTPVSRSGVKVQVFKLDWKWWWDQTGSLETQFRSQNLTQPILEGKIETNSNGEGSWPFQIKYPAWGRYLVRVIDPGGHITGKIAYIDWPGWAGRQREEQPGGASMLSFTADKKQVEVNQPVTVSIPSSPGSRILLSLETGQKVLETRWLETQEGETHYTFVATTDMVPNIYVHAMLIQPHSQTVNDLPIRLYGVIPVDVVDPNTYLHPILTIPDVLTPESECSLSISEKEGRPMTYTIALVDDGLLDLTRFKTPDPWSHFYQRQALKVRTWDMYDSVLGAFSGELKALLSIGGGGSGSSVGVPKANRFKPMVRFIGPFHLNQDETANHVLDIPNYVGSVRAMVVAGYDNNFGFTDKTIPVKKPLMLLGTLPRVLSPGEQFDFPLTVFALDPKVQDVELSIVPKGSLSVDGPTTKSLAFKEPGDETVAFQLTSSKQPGIGKITARASSGTEEAQFEIEIDVRNPNSMAYQTKDWEVQPGETMEYTPEPIGTKGTNSMVLEISTIPPLNLANRLDFLLTYPHGCIEQTTSAVFPQLFLPQLLDMEKPDLQSVEGNVKDGIQRIRTFQLPNGALAYWPGQGEASSWGSSYALHFLLKAKAQGYDIQDEFLKRLLSWQRLQANAWVPAQGSNELDQAYRLYLLSLADMPQIGAMNRFKESGLNRSVTRFLLAASYFLAGQQEIAGDMVRNLDWKVEPYSELSGTYGSPLRDQGLILEAMLVLNHSGTAELAREISKHLQINQWYNTQATGVSLSAMGQMAAKTSNPAKFEQRFGQDGWKTVQLDRPMMRTEAKDETAFGKSFGIRNQSDSVLFANLTLKGQPEIGNENQSQSGMSLFVSYEDEFGKSINPSQLEQGMDFVQIVTVLHTGPGVRYDPCALSLIYPSGWEIHHTDNAPSAFHKVSIPSYRDQRDDRVYLYFDLDKGTKRTFVTHLNASYKGHFYLPAVQVEAMYDNRIHARNKGQWVDVVQP